MNKQTKSEIKVLLEQYCSRFESVAKAAKTLKNVSEATISQIKKHNWELISEKMWINIAKQVGYLSSDWVSVETDNYLDIQELLSDAKDGSRVHAIIGGAGWGKDTGIKGFKADHENTYVINCSEFFNKKYFMIELLRAMGLSASGSVTEMVERAIRNINASLRPLIIINEVDKLKDEVLYFLITMYSLREEKCGIAVFATDQLEKRISRGLFLNKKGYQEIFSRFGRRFIELKKPSKADVKLACNANGVTDEDIVAEIYNSCEGDFRRVKKLVQNERTKGDQAA